MNLDGVNLVCVTDANMDPNRRAKANWFQPMGALGNAMPQIVHDKVVQFKTAGITWPGDCEDVVTKSVNQQSNVVGQGHIMITGSTSSAQRVRRTVG